MQVYHASTPPLSFLQARCPSCHQPTASKHWLIKLELKLKLTVFVLQKLKLMLHLSVIYKHPLKENDITTETKTWLDSNLSRQEPEEDLVPASSDEGL